MKMAIPFYAGGDPSRCACHIARCEIGGPGQARPKRASVPVVGAGRLGAAASVAALTGHDMPKAVETAMVIEGVRPALKAGGKSGRSVADRTETT
jgi:hypothetical protein